MKQVGQLMGCLAATLALASGCQATTATPTRFPIRILNSAPFSEPLATEYERRLPHVKTHLIGQLTAGRWSGVKGVLDIAESIQRNDADVGFASADAAYAAYLDASKTGINHIRGVAVLPAAPLHVLVRRGLSIKDVSALRGRRIRIGPEATVLTQLVLDSFRIPKRNVIVAGPLSTLSSRSRHTAALLSDGTVDAMFVSGHYPVESVSVAMENGARVLSLDGPLVDQLRERYLFIRALTVPARTYSYQPTLIDTVGVDVIFLCRSDLDEQLVYELTREFFAALPRLRPFQASLRLLDLEQAPATPFPLHKGAARYYREWELSR